MFLQEQTQWKKMEYKRVKTEKEFTTWQLDHKGIEGVEGLWSTTTNRVVAPVRHTTTTTIEMKEKGHGHHWTTHLNNSDAYPWIPPPLPIHVKHQPSSLFPRIYQNSPPISNIVLLFTCKSQLPRQMLAKCEFYPCRDCRWFLSSNDNNKKKPSDEGAVNPPFAAGKEVKSYDEVSCMA